MRSMAGAGVAALPRRVSDGDARSRRAYPEAFERETLLGRHTSARRPGFPDGAALPAGRRTGPGFAKSTIGRGYGGGRALARPLH